MTSASALGTTDGFCFQKKNGSKKSHDQQVTRWDLQSTVRELLPNERISRCNRVLARDAFYVRAKVQGGRAWFSGVVHCANPWACPVCAYRISQHRAKDVQTGIDNAVAYGAGVSFVTLTFRHGIDMELRESLAKFSKALRRLKSGRAYEQLRADFGIRGEVRALEVTHGRNGWHPHTHAVTFTERPLLGHDLTRLRRRIFVLWYRACEREGLPLPTYAHGVDVRPAKYAADYIAKWGFAAELTRGHLKTGNKGGRNPWQLLADAHHGDKRSAWLFREFAMTFKGRRQLLWSRGLREWLEVGAELTEQMILEIEPEEGVVEHLIDPDDWAIVVKFDARRDLLDACVEGAERLAVFLDALRRHALDVVGSDGRTLRRLFDPLVDAIHDRKPFAEYEPGADAA